MRILPKKEIVTLQQREREREVHEGTRLAHEVDRLRELRQTEEVNLKKFREATVEALQIELEKQQSNLDSLKAQIEVKEKELAAYFEKNPIDKKWLLFVQTEKKNIELSKRELHDGLTLLAAKQSRLEKAQRVSETQNADVLSEKHAVASLKKHAEKERISAKEELAHARSEAERIHVESRQRIADANVFEENIKLHAAEVKTRSDALDTREKELEQREMEVLIKELQYYSPVTNNQNVN